MNLPARDALGPFFLRDMARLVGLPDDADLDAIGKAVQALAAARLASMSHWQLIETAPTDGRLALVYYREGGIAVRRYAAPSQGERPRWIDVAGHNAGLPTHWMPLPDPPAADVPANASRDDEWRENTAWLQRKIESVNHLYGDALAKIAALEVTVQERERELAALAAARLALQQENEQLTARLRGVMDFLSGQPRVLPYRGGEAASKESTLNLAWAIGYDGAEDSDAWKLLVSRADRTATRAEAAEAAGTQLRQEYEKLLEDWREQDRALQDIFGECGVDMNTVTPAIIARLVAEEFRELRAGDLADRLAREETK